MTTRMEECPHGLEDPMWCGDCRTRLGFQLGGNRHRNDCTVITVATLTGVEYPEALELMAAQGRRPGQGARRDEVINALTEAGWTVTRGWFKIDDAIASGRSFYVSAQRGKNRHSYAIVNGEAINAGQYTRPGTRYVIYDVR